jgi:hypothetical protein
MSKFTNSDQTKPQTKPAAPEPLPTPPTVVCVGIPAARPAEIPTQTEK